MNMWDTITHPIVYGGLIAFIITIIILLRPYPAELQHESSGRKFWSALISFSALWIFASVIGYLHQSNTIQKLLHVDSILDYIGDRFGILGLLILLAIVWWFRFGNVRDTDTDEIDEETGPYGDEDDL